MSTVASKINCSHSWLEHGFTNPFCPQKNLLKRIATALFHVFTCYIPFMVVYLWNRCCAKRAIVQKIDPKPQVVPPPPATPVVKKIASELVQEILSLELDTQKNVAEKALKVREILNNVKTLDPQSLKELQKEYKDHFQLRSKHLTDLLKKRELTSDQIKQFDTTHTVPLLEKLKALRNKFIA